MDIKINMVRLIWCNVLAGCEWKTRYELQVETNQLLEMQTAGLSEKIDATKQSVKDGNKFNSAVFVSRSSSSSSSASVVTHHNATSFCN